MLLQYHPNCHVKFFGVFFLNFAWFIQSSPGLCNNYRGSQREVVDTLTDVCSCHLLWGCMINLKRTEFCKLISNGTANTAWRRVSWCSGKSLQYRTIQKVLLWSKNAPLKTGLECFYWLCPPPPCCCAVHEQLLSEAAAALLLAGATLVSFPAFLSRLLSATRSIETI